MKWLTSLTIAIGLACNPAFAQELTSAPASISPSHQQRDAFVTDLLKKMTLEEKIGQLRLISVGTDNPKEAIREMIRNGQVGAIFNTVTRPDIRAMQDQVMQLSRLKIPLFLPTTWCTASAPFSLSHWDWLPAGTWPRLRKVRAWRLMKRRKTA